MEKRLGPDSFNDESHQLLKEELTPIFLKLFQKTVDVRICSNSF